MPALYKFFFYAIFLIVAGSLALLLYTMLSHDTTWWEFYADIFLISLLVHSWFLAVALCIGEFWPRKYPRYAGQKISVLIPCFNEDLSLLEQAVRSVYEADGDKEIILINDGSNNDIEYAFRN